MIIGDSTACSEYAFHPTITKPPAADDNNNRGDNTPIDPSAVWAVVASALATSSQFPTNTLLAVPYHPP